MTGIEQNIIQGASLFHRSVAANAIANDQPDGSTRLQKAITALQTPARADITNGASLSVLDRIARKQAEHAALLQDFCRRTRMPHCAPLHLKNTGHHSLAPAPASEADKAEASQDIENRMLRFHLDCQADIAAGNAQSRNPDTGLTKSDEAFLQDFSLRLLPLRSFAHLTCAYERAAAFVAGQKGLYSQAQFDEIRFWRHFFTVMQDAIDGLRDPSGNSLLHYLAHPAMHRQKADIASQAYFAVETLLETAADLPEDRKATRMSLLFCDWNKAGQTVIGLLQAAPGARARQTATLLMKCMTHPQGPDQVASDLRRTRERNSQLAFRILEHHLEAGNRSAAAAHIRRNISDITPEIIRDVHERLGIDLLSLEADHSDDHNASLSASLAGIGLYDMEAARIKLILSAENEDRLFLRLAARKRGSFCREEQMKELHFRAAMLRRIEVLQRISHLESDPAANRAALARTLFLAPGRDGRSALHLAAMYDNYDMVAFILDQCRNKSVLRRLALARSRRASPVTPDRDSSAEVLAMRDIVLDEDALDLSPLILAAQYQSEASASLLLETLASPCKNYLKRQQVTPLQASKIRKLENRLSLLQLMAHTEPLASEIAERLNDLPRPLVLATDRMSSPAPVGTGTMSAGKTSGTTKPGVGRLPRLTGKEISRERTGHAELAPV